MLQAVEKKTAWSVARGFFAPPHFADEEKTRAARLLNAIAWTSLVLVGITVVTTLLFVEPSLRINHAIDAGFAVLLVTVLLLNRRGAVRIASWLFCAVLWLGFTVLIVSVQESGLIHSVLVSYIALVLIAGLLLGGWAGMGTAAASAAVGIAVLVLNPSVGVDPGLVLTVAVNLVVAAVLLFLATGDMRGALSQAYASNRELENIRRELEVRVAAEETLRRGLQRTARQYADFLSDVARGDFLARLSLTADGPGSGGSDPLIALGHKLNETVASLQQMALQIRDAAQNLGLAAAEILAATSQQLGGATEQSAAMSQAMTTVDEVKVIGDQTLVRAQEVTSAAQRTVQVSRGGQQAVQDSIDSMADIKGQVEGIAANIVSLAEHTRRIGDIIATVNELASQSNMLALNAAVEAARAGEHGRGFAVVAQEVRSLAEQSRQATAQVRDILEQVQKATNQTVAVTQEGTRRVENGARLAALTGETIRQLAGVIDESAQAAVQMAAGSRQQTAGIEQIAAAMENMSQATTYSLGGTRQTEKSAQDLNALARRLAETVAQYRLD